ncbi:acyltransferase family protein [Pantoea ananatis]|uniref:acyltransferase family protein n=2 Tax=Pantoea ananas TaxID=553 RepID=UPI001B3102AE|nr:acyltransferase [Pantoea ananatis]
MDRLKGLDGIRGLLALTVAIVHTLGHLTGWQSGLNPIKNASYAVDVFFMMSGIVLYHVYKEDICSRKVSIPQFIGIRFLRLYPLHLITIISVPIILKFSTGEFLPTWIGRTDFSNILGDLSLLNAMSVGFDLSLNQPSWSISVEFYLGSLLVILFCKKRYMTYITTALGITLAIALKINPIDIREPYILLANGGIIRCLYSMSVGVISYELFFTKRKSIAGNSLIKAIGLLGVVSLFFTITFAKLNTSSYLFITPLIALSIVCITISDSNAFSFLDKKILRILGKRSYSIYLLHTPIVYMALFFRSDSQHGNLFLSTLCIIITVFLSKYSEKYVEQPFIKYSHVFKKTESPKNKSD